MSSSRGSQKGRQLVTATRQETWTVHTWVRTQRIQLGGQGHQAYGPWATHRDVGHQLQSYEGGSRSCQKGGPLAAVSAKHCSSCSLRRWLGPLPWAGRCLGLLASSTSWDCSPYSPSPLLLFPCQPREGRCHHPQPAPSLP